MSLERRYARLLGWYPEPFRSAHAQEVLAVLMAGAGEGQRRPRPREYSDMIRSAVGMRLRGARSAGWVDALATTPAASSGSDLIGSPMPIHLALLFLPSLLLACGTVITVVLTKRRRTATADAAHLSQLRRLFTTADGWS